MPAVRPETDCPDFGTLLDWLEGRLESDTAERVAAYVAEADERTHRTVDWLRGFLRTAETLPLHEPPPIVRQSLNQYFARWSRTRPELDQAPREVHVQLLFDSRQDLALTGVRAAASEDDVIHLVYGAEEGDLLIDAYRIDGGSVRLDGQVLLAEPRGAPIFEASVTGSDYTMRTKDGDELGRFSLRGVREGHCQLRASNGVIMIVADIGLEPRDG
jgi:hypothetical protein